MLPATLKLCCGISHQHLRKLTGLQRPAVGAFGKEISRFILSEASCYFRNMPDAVHRTIHRKLGISPKPSNSENATLSSREMFYLNQVDDALHKAIAMLHQQEIWVAERHQENGDTIFSKSFPQIGKVFRAEAVLDFPPDCIYSQLFEKLDQMDRWNPSISEVQVLQRIGKNTLLTREVTSEILVNVISKRDFVSVRHGCKRGSAFYLVGTATNSDLMPPQKGMIRAEAGLTCIVLQPLEEDSQKTRMTWLLSLDLKGRILKPITNYALYRSQVDFIAHLRKHLSLLPEST
uniref:START domain-containing protein 1 n=1 Tax=Leptobrachium leishanense TaxID=445787 RepID=A0A8C5PTU9_9ANUR